MACPRDSSSGWSASAISPKSAPTDSALVSRPACGARPDPLPPGEIMTKPKIVSQDEWIKARKSLLAKEKNLTRLHDELARERQNLPWTRVEKNYTFDAPDGKVSLADLFGPHSQLFV